MNLKSIIARYSVVFGISALGIITACQPEEFEGNGNGIISPTLDASFTVVPVTVEGKINTYVFRLNNISNVLGIRWNLGDGNFAAGKQQTDTIFFPDADTYTIGANLTGIGGETFSSNQQLVIETSDPNSGNLLTGGKFNAGDETQWQTLQYSDGVSPVFENNKVVFKGGSGGHAGIYNTVEVIAGQKYKLDMSVSGSGATDTWFEVYIGTQVPIGGKDNDYNDGGTLLGLNTWAGCGKSSFADKLSAIACSGSARAEKGIVQFATSGTYYLVIRTGGADLGTDGISVDNIELRPAN